jgi:hypothetical protein
MAAEQGVRKGKWRQDVWHVHMKGPEMYSVSLFCKLERLEFKCCLKFLVEEEAVHRGEREQEMCFWVPRRWREGKD